MKNRSQDPATHQSAAVNATNRTAALAKAALGEAARLLQRWQGRCSVLEMGSGTEQSFATRRQSSSPRADNQKGAGGSEGKNAEPETDSKALQ